MATILRKEFIQDSPKMKIGTYIIVGLLVLLVVLGYVEWEVSYKKETFIFLLPGIVPCLYTFLVISIWNWKEAVFVHFVSMIIAHLVVGSLLPLLWWMGISNVFLTKILPLAVPLY